TDLVRLKSIATLLSNESKAKELVNALTPIVAAIKKIPPDVTVEEVKKEAGAVASADIDWQRDDDVFVQKRLLTLARRIDRIRRLKRGGLAALPQQISEPLRKVLASA